MNILEEFHNANLDEPDPAKKILFTVFFDLIARVGFRSFWQSCTTDVKIEILNTNLEKIRHAQRDI